MCIIVVLLFFLKGKKNFFLIFLSLLFIFIGLKFFNKIDVYTLGFLYPEQNIVAYKETRYGRLVLTETNDQFNFYENNTFLSSTFQPIENEEVVHFSASQCEQLKSVLLIGGGISGTLNELLKYDPDFINYIELDHNIINLAYKYSLFKKHPKINIYNSDGRLYLKKTEKKFDLIIVDLPDPLNIQLNRFYTMEFFNLVKRRLNKNGVFSFSISSNENYLNEYQIANNSSLRIILKKYFKNILIIPGNINFFIASDKELSYEIDKLIIQKNISTQYVNKYYLDSRLSEQKIDFLKKALKDKAQINHDFRPFIFFNSIKNWLLEFGKINKLIIILLISILIIIIFLQSKASFIILSTGFSQAVIQILILLGFQIIVGYLYYALGILISFFILGMAIGSYIANKINYNSKKLILIAELYILFIILFFLLYIFLIKDLNNIIIINFSFLFISLLISVPVGFQFPICAKLEKGSNTIIGAKLYSSDLLGAYFGTLLTGILFVPVLGYFNVIILIFIIKIISFIVSFTIDFK
jgi:spermidine synthase